MNFRNQTQIGVSKLMYGLTYQRCPGPLAATGTQWSGVMSSSRDCSAFHLLVFLSSLWRLSLGLFYSLFWVKMVTENECNIHRRRENVPKPTSSSQGPGQACISSEQVTGPLLSGSVTAEEQQTVTKSKEKEEGWAETMDSTLVTEIALEWPRVDGSNFLLKRKW